MGISGSGEKPFSTISGSCYVGMKESEISSKKQKKEFKKTDANRDGTLQGSEIVARRRQEALNMAIEGNVYNVLGGTLAVASTISTASIFGAPAGAGLASGSAFLFGAGTATAGKSIVENLKTDKYEKQHKNDEDY